MKNSKAGFSQIIILLLVIAVAAVAGTMYFKSQNKVKVETPMAQESKSKEQVTFPTSTKDIPEVKNANDVVKLDAALDSAEMTKIDTMLDDNNKDSASF